MPRSVIQEDIIYPNIGKDQRMESVGCRVQLNYSAYQYDKNNNHLLQRLVKTLSKSLKWAWLRIERKSRHNKKKPQSFFLPRALNEGKNEIYKNYLPQLQRQKIWSYINLNVPIQALHGQRIEMAITKLTNKRYRDVFHHFKILQSNDHCFLNYNSRQQILKNRVSESPLRKQQMSYDQHINVTIQRVYIDSKSKATNRQQRQHLTSQTETKIRYKNFDFGQQYGENDLRTFDERRSVKSKHTKSDRSRPSSSHVSKKQSSSKYNINPQDSCNFCDALELMPKSRKVPMSFLTTQTFLQDHF